MDEGPTKGSLERRGIAARGGRLQQLDGAAGEGAVVDAHPVGVDADLRRAVMRHLSDRGDLRDGGWAVPESERCDGQTAEGHDRGRARRPPHPRAGLLPWRSRRRDGSDEPVAPPGQRLDEAGVSAWSPRASRRRRTAVFRPCFDFSPEPAWYGRAFLTLGKKGKTGDGPPRRPKRRYQRVGGCLRQLRRRRDSGGEGRGPRVRTAGRRGAALPLPRRKRRPPRAGLSPRAPGWP